LIGLEGWEGVVASVSPGSDLVEGEDTQLRGEKTIEADQFVSKFDGSGEMTAIEFFGGKRPVTVELKGDTPRTVEARSGRLNLAEGGGAESLELYGSIRLEEKSDLGRAMHAERLVVTIDQQTGEATSAVFDGNVRYSDTKNEARSERIFYDIREETVTLSSVPGAAPTISSGPQRVSAEQIVVEPGGGVLRASGRVSTRISDAEGTSIPSETNLFPKSAAIFVNSDSLAIRERDGFASFSGDVRAWQGNNTLFADSLQIRSNGEMIDAEGNVRTILENTQDPKGEPIRSRSDRLEARRAENEIDLIDDVMIESEGRSLGADQARFIFGSDQQLERVVATGSLSLKEAATGRRGSGEKAVYELAEDTILIEGSPAEIREPRGTVRGQQIVLDLGRNRVDVLQGDSPTEATYNAESGVR
ncbi:MAG: LptA/OstA family protein, partial [Thermoanaerobaculia bacterium]|nr:LptA/OstA family protein [Thermoanaerobaculia bacterium]